jgi:hypothetical protein
MIVGPCTRYGEIYELYPVAVCGHLDLAFCTADDASDGFNVRIEGKNNGVQERNAQSCWQDIGEFHQ